MRTESPEPVRGAALWALVLCTLLGLLFGAVAYLAVLGKSPTYDEPFHLVGGYMRQKHGDFRFNVEDPALFGRAAGLMVPAGALTIPNPARVEAAAPHAPLLPDRTDEELFRSFPKEPAYQWVLVARALYQTRGTDADALVQRARLLFTLLGVALLGLVAWWSWKLGGAVAAVTSAVLLGFDPNFMAHAPLVKNDVPTAFLMLATLLCAWRVGVTGGWGWVAGLALGCAAAFNTKFSGTILLPVTLILLLVRAIAPLPWRLAGFELATRAGRVVGAVATWLIVVVVTVAVTWACYGFRYEPSTDPELRLDSEQLAELARQRGAAARAFEMDRDGVPVPEIQKFLETGIPRQPTVRFALWVEELGVLPRAWTNGFIYTYATTRQRSSFLMGEYSVIGWRAFFPLAMLFKTPVATIAMVLLVPAVLVGLLCSRRTWVSWGTGWTLLCIGLAPGIYFLTAVLANLNLGLRHVLPVYPFLFVGVAWGVALLWREIPRFRWIAAALAIGLVVESSMAYPNYLAFFNRAVGGSAGGIELLSDSNLDWGQDLKLLADWRRKNPDKPLYVSYFGFADPRFYGIDGIWIPGEGLFSLLPVTTTMEPGSYLAVSATSLQGTYFVEPMRTRFRTIIERQKKLGVLGGTIHLYEVAPPETTSSP
jgi:4-amino-4-deoxy-L-arabinose transferase-like glycosyltransferase